MEQKQSWKNWSSGTVYIIDSGDGETFKIGFTTVEPEKRLQQISCANVLTESDMKLVMSFYTDLNPRYLENLIHMKYDNYHFKSEWFKLTFLEIAEIYHILNIFSTVTIYERWYELVPSDLYKYLEHVGTVGVTIPFATKSEELSFYSSIKDMFTNV